MSADTATLNEVSAPGVDAHDPPSRWKLLSSTLRAQRRNLIIGSAVGLLWMVGKVSVPLLVRYSIDRGIEQDDMLLLWVSLIALAGVAIGLFTALRRFYAFREARWTETRLREQMFNHILSLHIGYHDRAQTGQLMSRSSSDLNQIQSFVVMIPITVSNFAMIIAVSVILFVTDWKLALIALAPLPFVNVAGRRFSHSIHSAVLAVQAEQAELATVVEETVGGIRVVKGFGAEAVQSTRLRKEADDIRTESIGAARIRAKFLPAIELLPQLGLIAVLAVGGMQVINGDLTTGQLVQFNFYVALLVGPLRMLGMTIAWAQRAGAALERVNEILDTAPIVVDPERPLALPPAKGPVRCNSAASDSATTPTCPCSTDSISTSHPGSRSRSSAPRARESPRSPGSWFASTTSTRGGSASTVSNVRDLPVHDVRRAVGIVFEDTLLFHDTVAANIAFAEPDADIETIERAARLAGAHDFIMGLPDAYDTKLGERGFSLSGGQRQRIAIARAILADPRVLVLDDATSAVDPSKEHEIRSAMSTVMEGRTTIVIAHRPGTIALADTVVLLDGGRVVATGPHQELLDTEPRYRAVLAAMEAEDDEARAELAAALPVESQTPIGGD